VLQPGFTKGLLDVLSDRAALTGDQGGRHPACRAGEDRSDATRHVSAQLPQFLAPSDVARRVGNPMSSTERVADATDPGEIKLALKIAPAGQDLGRHRVEHRLEADPIAGVQLVTVLRNMEAHPTRLIHAVEAQDRIDFDYDAPAFLNQIDIAHPPGDRDRRQMTLQHRRLVFPSALAHQRETRSKSRQRQRRLAPRRVPTQRDYQATPGGGRSNAWPQRRLDREPKVEADAGAKKYWQPQQPPLALGREAIGERAKNAGVPFW